VALCTILPRYIDAVFILIHVNLSHLRMCATEFHAVSCFCCCLLGFVGTRFRLHSTLRRVSAAGQCRHIDHASNAVWCVGQSRGGHAGGNLYCMRHVRTTSHISVSEIMYIHRGHSTRTPFLIRSTTHRRNHTLTMRRRGANHFTTCLDAPLPLIWRRQVPRRSMRIASSTWRVCFVAFLSVSWRRPAVIRFHSPSSVYIYNCFPFLRRSPIRELAASRRRFCVEFVRSRSVFVLYARQRPLFRSTRYALFCLIIDVHALFVCSHAYQSSARVLMHRSTTCSHTHWRLSLSLSHVITHHAGARSKTHTGGFDAILSRIETRSRRLAHVALVPLLNALTEVRFVLRAAFLTSIAPRLSAAVGAHFLLLDDDALKPLTRVTIGKAIGLAERVLNTVWAAGAWSDEDNHSTSNCEYFKS
jgi:hypothetical protein